LKGEKTFKTPRDIPNNMCHTMRNTSNPDGAFQFAPAWTGDIKPTAPKISFEGNCFEQITFEMNYDPSTPDVFHVTATTEKPRSLKCSDWFLFAN
jgi:hypothetical protein